MVSQEKISISELEEMESLSIQIDNDSTKVEDYKRYEELLLKTGLELTEIRRKMNKYGYSTYEDYIRAKKNPRTNEERKIVNIKIVAGLVVLFAIAMYMIVKEQSENLKPQAA
jgi:hypothetical protein